MPILAEVAITNLTNIVTGITSAATWIFSMFSSFITMIASNDLILYPVILTFVVGAAFGVFKIIKSFGLKGRR